MKKLVLLMIVFAAITACKKKYSCSCNTTYYYSGGQQNFVAKTTSLSEKMTKKQATSVCEHEAESVDTTWTNYITNYGNSPASGQRFFTTCTLK